MPLPKSMRAVIFKDVFDVAVEDRPVPKIQHPRDAILKVTSTALCGSDLVGPAPWVDKMLTCRPAFL